MSEPEDTPSWTQAEAISLGNQERWVDLYDLGKDAWNTWAADVQRQLDAGEMITTRINFSGRTFERDAYFSGFIFPLSTRFSMVTFSGKADFVEAQFSSDANFSEVEFNGGAWFSESQFSSNANFSEVQFSGIAWFKDVQFSGDALFWESQFNYNASFKWTRFIGDASFICAKFEGEVDFSDAVFDKKIDLSFIQCQTNAPKFMGTYFAPGYPPDMTHAVLAYPYQTSLIGKWFGIAKEELTEPKFRILKRLAAEDHNHELEQQMFAFEMRAKRHWTYQYTKPHHWPHLAYNHIYDLLSGFGQSWLRPLMMLGVIWALGVWGYAHMDNNRAPDQVFGPQVLEFGSTAHSISLSNLFPFAGQALLARHVAIDDYCQTDTNTDAKDLPCIRKIYFISAAQGLASIAALFLFGLALRNKGRMK